MPHMPQAPLQTGSAWYGRDLADRQDWLYRLSDTEIQELAAEVRRTARLMADSGRGLIDLTAADFRFRHLRRALERWTDSLRRGYGFVQIKGWPAADFSEQENSLAYWSIGLMLGRPVPQNTDGDVLGHIRDTGADPEDPSVRLYKTRARQDFHADGSDIIGLMCLHPAKAGGESKLVSSVTIFNEVLVRRPDLAPLLFEPFCFDLHEQQAPGAKPYWTMPICSYGPAGLRTWFAEWYIRMAQRHPEVPRLTPEQNELIDLIVRIANDPEIHLDIEFDVGDMQFLKNAVILHARGAYEDHDDPARKRHLLRLWLARPDFDDGDAGLREGIRSRQEVHA
ncbi:MAG TPA: TauD/TfdA family dioxygenase [Pseudomonadales bacterium]